MMNKDSISNPPLSQGFTSRQMELFQTFFGNEEEVGRLSNTIELWDAVPKYAISAKRQTRMRNTLGGLEPVTMSFQHRGKTYAVTLYPAKVQDRKGKWIDRFPAEREELVEDGLRKLAADRQQGFFDKYSAGVVFTAKQLIGILSDHGHKINYYDLVTSLEILKGASVSLSRQGERKSFFHAPILTELGAVSLEDWRRDKSARWYVRFNSIIETCILAKTYRQFDFAKMMAHTSQVSRWLYKRMAHVYLQASLADPYQILLTTIKRDSRLLNAASLRHDAQTMRQVLAEMKSQDVLVGAHEQRRYGSHRRLLDILYTLIPHPTFIRQVKAANKRTKMLDDM